MSKPSFGERRVLALENRRAPEIASLIATFGGRPVVAPALREVPCESNEEALALTDAIARGDFDAVIFLTGVGARALVAAADSGGRRQPLLDGLRQARVIVRGPKPAAVMRELGVPVWANAPEPSTWRELMAAVSARYDEWTLAGARVAVQEYGAPNVDLLDALRAEGARVTTVRPYRWAMPENVEPLRSAVKDVAAGRIDVLLITSGIQIVHFLEVAREMGLEPEVRQALSRVTIASIGPAASAEIRRQGLVPAFEPAHPRMGQLVREAAEHVAR